MPLDELCALIARHARPDTTTAIEDVHIAAIDHAGPAAPEMSGTALALITQGAKRIAAGDRVYEYRAGQYLIASIDMPITGRFTLASPRTPALGLAMTLRPAAVAELLLQAAPGDIPPLGGPAPSGLAVGTAGPELLDAALRLVRLLDHPRDIAVLAPGIRREVLWRLITGEQGAAVRQLGLADSSLTHIARSVRWIRDNYSESFRVEDLARQSGMSVSAFYRNFNAVTALSPIQFQKQIRLQHAHLLLAAGPGDIAGIARRVGYDSPSQFSREYRRHFGTTPRQQFQTTTPDRQVHR
ncbi:AraC family transcriptional regulator [Nocardia sp. NPDC005366]|uniref:AraC family transcriptional regulator n=1 Tax=Nocardia sp. NPDC005366 TaxID=3156878 RepID=UPI0033A57957